MFDPADIPHWVVLIYERQQRFRQEAAGQMITGLVNACEAVGEPSKQFRHPRLYLILIGITINRQPALVRWESGQGNILRVRHFASFLVRG